MSKRILVTGGAGFIGSFLCEKLVQQGHYVICCDNFYTGNKNNLENILDHKNFELIRHDITFPLFLEVDQIYNFATRVNAPFSPISNSKDPHYTVDHTGSIILINPEGNYAGFFRAPHNQDDVKKAVLDIVNRN